MANKYTAADFANSRFAEHKDGSVIARCNPDSTLAWENDECLLSDGEMARTGWVPVPTKTTITESKVRNATTETRLASCGVHPKKFLAYLGIEVIPDPEPTNTERLTAILNDGGFLGGWANHRNLAEYLTDHGVTAPNVKDN